MSAAVPPTPAPSLTERLDLALAARVAAHEVDRDPWSGADRFLTWLRRPACGDAAWIGAVLRLRGFLIFDDDVAHTLAGRSVRLPVASQESAMALGMAEVLRMLRERSGAGQPPDGCFLMEAFQVLTRGLARFRASVLRTGEPWDAVVHVGYPRPTELPHIMATFDAAHRYRDLPILFDRLHPVRQAFRVLWRLCRIAPFADLNLVLGWVAMNAWLLARGYPLLTPEAKDRELIQRMVAGPPPVRVVQWESRLLAQATPA